MTDEPFSTFQNGVVLAIGTRRENGDLLRCLQQNQPDHPYLHGAPLFSEASNAESLLNVDPRNLLIPSVEERRAAVATSNSDLLRATPESRAVLPHQQVATLIDQMQDQLRTPPAPAPWIADPKRNAMWGESGYTPYHDCVATRTFVRKTGEGRLYVVQDRLTATVTLPDLRLVVFSALVWQRITATN